ncbi:hypothetical protein R6Q59_023537 [Mikania micrantha]
MASDVHGVNRRLSWHGSWLYGAIARSWTITKDCVLMLLFSSESMKLDSSSHISGFRCYCFFGFDHDQGFNRVQRLLPLPCLLTAFHLGYISGGSTPLTTTENHRPPQTPPTTTENHRNLLMSADFVRVWEYYGRLRTMPPRLLIAIDYSMRHSVTQIDYSSASPRLLASSLVGRSHTATTEQAAGKPVGIWAQFDSMSNRIKTMNLVHQRRRRLVMSELG